MKTPSKKFVINQKKSIWSFFLSIYVFLPLANSFEIIIYNKQNSSFLFMIFLWLILFLSFTFFPKIYDNTIEFMFSYPIETYLHYLQKSMIFLSRYPRVVGFFYGICFLSFFVRVEFPENSLILYINNFLLILRNLLLFPYLGFNLLFFWVNYALEDSLQQGNISENFLYSLKRRDIPCPEPNSPYVSFIPLLKNNTKAYNYTTKRNILTFVRAFYNLPGKEHLSQVVHTTIGTTAVGSLAITTYTSGLQSDRLINQQHEKTHEFCHKILENPNSIPFEKDIARSLLSQAVEVRNTWYSEAGSNTTFRGINILSRVRDANAIKNRSSTIFQQANELSTINHYSQAVRYKKFQFFIEKYGYKDLQVSSPLEKCLSFFAFLFN